MKIPGTLPVSEVFGPTFQGEGPHTGRRTGFVRLGMCNLSCEWCDTPYTWDTTRYDVKAEAPDTPIPEVHQRLRELDVDTVCLSGGEPLIHRATLPELLVQDWVWHAETNGTIAPPYWWHWQVDYTSVSPKINTRDPRSKRLKWGPLEAWAALVDRGRAAFKFVAVEEADLDVIGDLVGSLGVRASSVWVMPEGTDAETLLDRHRKLAQHIQDRGWNTSTRLHVLLYGSERLR